jgi:hypothetical protein
MDDQFRTVVEQQDDDLEQVAGPVRAEPQLTPRPSSSNEYATMYRSAA